MDDHFDADKPDAAQLEAQRANLVAFRDQHRTLGNAALAIAFIEKHGSATSTDLSVLLGLAADQYPSVELRSSVQGERLVCSNRVWTLGPKAYQGAREKDEKADALASGADLGKREAPPLEVPRFAAAEPAKKAAAPLKELKSTLDEPAEPAAAAPAVKPSRFRFAIWSDGLVEVKATGMPSLELSLDDVDQLIAFVAARRGERALSR